MVSGAGKSSRDTWLFLSPPRDQFQLRDVTRKPDNGIVMKLLRLLAGWSLAVLVLILRWSCRVRWHADPRPALREAGIPYAYAILHCHQVAAVIGAEHGTAAMVSRSVDGDLLVPSLRVAGVVPVRGSTRRRGKSKGGGTALRALLEHVRGGRPAYLAVDGPRGPRGHVNRGIARLASATGAAIVIAAPIPRHRYTFAKAWDRFQIPLPFTPIDMFFGEPLRMGDDEDVEAFRRRVETALAELENRHDPGEAELGKTAADAQQVRLDREAREHKAGKTS